MHRAPAEGLQRLTIIITVAHVYQAVCNLSIYPLKNPRCLRVRGLFFAVSAGAEIPSFFGALPFCAEGASRAFWELGGVTGQRGKMDKCGGAPKLLLSSVPCQ